MADQDSATRKRRVRAGQKSSTTRIIAQAHEAIESTQTSLATFERFLSTLREKGDINLRLDPEILEVTLEEEDVIKEIEEADVYREKIELAIVAIEQAVIDMKASRIVSDRSEDRTRPSNVSVDTPNETLTRLTSR
eukprot:Em0012g476a